MVGNVGRVPPFGVFAMPAKKIQTATRFAVANIVTGTLLTLTARGIPTTGPKIPKVMPCVTKYPIFQNLIVRGEFADENLVMNSLSEKYL